MTMRLIFTFHIALACLVTPYVAVADESSSAPTDVLTRALVDELERSMKGLKLGELPMPYLIQLNAQDRRTLTMNATYGGITANIEQRDRYVSSRVRIGSYNLDNTNFGRPFGNAGRLPLEDDYTALRHAIWSVLDVDYKRAVETLTAKRAYLKDHTVEDRPDDYTPAKAVVAAEAFAKLELDRAQWAHRLETISARFNSYPRVQDASVSFVAASADSWIVNSEGTRLRTADHGVLIRIEASLQAKDGMPLSDSLSYLGLTTDDLPALSKVIADIDELCTKLMTLADAPTIDHYTGPVLFDPVAAGTAFHALLADALCAQPVPIGSGWEDQSFQNRIGLRILPRSFSLYVDPTVERFDGKVLAGSYAYDDEATPAQRVTLVEKGILKTLVSARAPTRKIKTTTGHGRNAGFGDAFASISVLYVEDKDGLAVDELKEELIVAAKEEGLDYALHVETIAEGGYGELGNPIRVLRVNVEDGREELVRGLTFLPVTPRVLKRVLAAGNERRVYNALSQTSASFITPAILFEELDLTRNQKEFATPPILPSPLQRANESSNSKSRR